MHSKFFLVFFSFFLIFFSAHAQNHEFYGALTIKGKTETIISYKIAFKEVDGKIEGYSVTDILGDHETKSKISGFYNHATKQLSIKESEIVYTKSKVDKSQFCFVNFNAKVNINKDKAKIEDAFTGKYPDGKKCAEGKVIMIGAKTVDKLLATADKQIQKSKDLSQEEKNELNMVQLFDNVNTQKLSSNQQLNIFTSSEEVTFEIWDGGVEDRDSVNMYHNGNVLLKDYFVTKRKKTLKVKLSDTDNIFKVEAINQGWEGLNTVMINIVGDNEVSFQTNLRTGETTSVNLIKKKK